MGAAEGLEWWEVEELESERRQEGVGRLLRRVVVVVVHLSVEEGLWSARRGLGRWIGGEFRRFYAEDGRCEVSLLARLLCSAL